MDGIASVLANDFEYRSSGKYSDNDLIFLTQLNFNLNTSLFPILKSKNKLNTNIGPNYTPVEFYKFFPVLENNIGQKNIVYTGRSIIEMLLYNNITNRTIEINMYNVTEDVAFNTLNNFAKQFISKKYIVYNKNDYVVFVVDNTTYKFNLNIYKTVAELLTNVDVCSKSICFDNSGFRITNYGLHCFTNMYNIYDPSRVSENYVQNLIDDYKIGFSIGIPGYDITKFDRKYIDFGYKSLDILQNLVFVSDEIIENNIYVYEFLCQNKKIENIEDKIKKVNIHSLDFERIKDFNPQEEFNLDLLVPKLTKHSISKYYNSILLLQCRDSNVNYDALLQEMNSNIEDIYNKYVTLLKNNNSKITFIKSDNNKFSCITESSLYGNKYLQNSLSSIFNQYTTNPKEESSLKKENTHNSVTEESSKKPVPKKSDSSTEEDDSPPVKKPISKRKADSSSSDDENPPTKKSMQKKRTDPSNEDSQQLTKSITKKKANYSSEEDSSREDPLPVKKSVIKKKTVESSSEEEISSSKKRMPKKGAGKKKKSIDTDSEEEAPPTLKKGSKTVLSPPKNAPKMKGKQENTSEESD